MMKKLLATALAVMVILTTNIVVFATEVTHQNTETTTIRVGYLENYGIITTPIVQGSEGYGYEYLEKIEEYTNYHFEYVALSWSEGLEQLKSGEIDLLAPASMSEERKEVYDFVDTIFLHEETNIYALENSEYHYGEPQDLDGKIFGTFEGSVYEERFEAYAKEHGLEYTLLYTSPSTVLEDLSSGKIDLYIDGSLYWRDDLHSVNNIYSEELYLMIQKGNDSLKSALNSAMLAIEAEKPYYNELLWYKYYATAPTAPQSLTTEEDTALQSKDVYTVGYHADLHPVSYTLNGEPMGYSIDVMNILAEKLGITIQYVPLYDGNEHSTEDVDFNLCPLNDESTIYGTLSEPYNMQNLLVVTNDGVAKSDVQNILVPDYGTIRIEDFLGSYSSATIYKSYSSTDSQHIYDTVDLDCIIIPECLEIFVDFNDDKTNKSIGVLNVSVPMGIIVSNELPIGVRTALNKAIQSLTKSTVDELVRESTLNIQIKPTFAEILSEYQRQIETVVFVIVAAFLFVLWKSRKKTKRLLEVDTLTGAMTQYKFTKEAQRILATAKPSEYMMVLLDVDKFKSINKFYGTKVGDKFLGILANTLKRQTQRDAIVGRIQSDSFAILTKVNGNSGITLDDLFEQEVKMAGIDMTVYFSIGVYTIENVTDNISYMLDNARTAKSYGKTIFGNTVHYFTKEHQAKHEKETLILSSMEDAIKDEEFFIVVQPKVELQTKQLVGGEVLVRWKKKDGTFIYPDEFIPLFEENKFIIQLDYYVLKKTCEFIRDSKLALPVLSINVSAITMLEPDFIQSGLDIMEHYGVVPQQIEVELTESVLDADYKHISKTISRLKKAGFSIAIDDFGKGASSIARINEIEVDVLKLDKEFMENDTESEKSKLVLNTIISMANDLGIISLVEGIETKEQQDLLIRLGCEQGQGYYFDRPLSIADFTQRVEANSKMTFEPMTRYQKDYRFWTKSNDLPYGVVAAKNDQYTTIIQANPAFYALIGYTKEEFSEKHKNRLANILIDNLYDDIVAKKPTAGDVDVQCDMRVRRADGGITWAHNSVQYHSKAGVFFITFTDITDKMITSDRHLSYEAFQSRNEIVSYINLYTNEYIIVTDSITNKVVYMNPPASNLLEFQLESEWQGKPYCEIGFGSQDAAPASYYEPVTEDKFTVREYYNDFHKMYVHVKSKLVNVPALQRKMCVTIVTDMTTEKKLESKLHLQNTLHNCIEALFTANSTNKTAEEAYYDLLNQLRTYYHADRVFFYKFKEETNVVESVYEVLADGCTKEKPDLPIILTDYHIKLLEELTKISTSKYMSVLEALDEDTRLDLQELQMEGFSCVAIHNSMGKIVAFMGVVNPKSNEDEKDLMRLLSRSICMFIEREQDNALKQEELKQNSISEMKLVEKSINNFQSLISSDDHIIDMLDALCNHYDAEFAIILTRNKDGSCSPSYVGGQTIPDFTPFQNQASYIMERWIKRFEKNPLFISDINSVDLSEDNVKRILDEKFGIYNFIVSPIKAVDGTITGLLFVNNFKHSSRSRLMVHIVAKHISDYLAKIKMYEKNQLEPATGLMNKTATQNKISELLQNNVNGVLFVIDIDNFKGLNDTLGHQTGDKAIADIADNLKQTFRSADVIGRIGGDEFMVFCPSLVATNFIEAKAKQILEKCKRTYGKDGLTVEISASVGVCCVDEQCKTFESLYENADNALYIAKKGGKNRYHIYASAEHLDNEENS